MRRPADRSSRKHSVTCVGKVCELVYFGRGRQNREFVAKKTRALYHKLHDRPKDFSPAKEPGRECGHPAALERSLMRGLLQSLPRWPTSHPDDSAGSRAALRGSNVTIK